MRDFAHRMALVLAGVFALAACSSSISAEKIAQIHPAMKVDQVEALLGPPVHIDQSETTGLRGEVYYYPGPEGEGRVIFLNDAVFKAEFVPEGKKT
jgi:outer membrane protein assembly factor BamE (lipoprotein component of BamABCDE complex)